MRYLNNNNEQYIVSTLASELPIDFYFTDLKNEDIVVSDDILIIDVTSENSLFKTFSREHNIKCLELDKNKIIDDFSSYTEQIDLAKYVLFISADNTVITKSLTKQFIDSYLALQSNGIFAGCDVPTYNFINVINIMTYGKPATRYINHNIWFGEKDNFKQLFESIKIFFELAETKDKQTLSFDAIVDLFVSTISYKIIDKYVDINNSLLTTVSDNIYFKAEVVNDELVTFVKRKYDKARDLLLI